MRTTVSIDDGLLTEAKRIALASGTTLSGVIETAMRQMLAKRQQGRPKNPSPLVTYAGRGLKRGVDLDDAAALLDLLESP